jgi:hypothetical protein
VVAAADVAVAEDAVAEDAAAAAADVDEISLVRKHK